MFLNEDAQYCSWSVIWKSLIKHNVVKVSKRRLYLMSKWKIFVECQRNQEFRVEAQSLHCTMVCHLHDKIANNNVILWSSKSKSFYVPVDQIKTKQHLSSLDLASARRFYHFYNECFLSKRFYLWPPFPPPRNPQAPLPRCNFSNETQSVERGGSLPVCFKLEMDHQDGSNFSKQMHIGNTYVGGGMPKRPQNNNIEIRTLYLYSI